MAFRNIHFLATFIHIHGEILIFSYFYSFLMQNLYYFYSQWSGCEWILHKKSAVFAVEHKNMLHNPSNLPLLVF